MRFLERVVRAKKRILVDIVQMYSQHKIILRHSVLVIYYLLTSLGSFLMFVFKMLYSTVFYRCILLGMNNSNQYQVRQESNAVKFAKPNFFKVSFQTFKILQNTPLWHTYFSQDILCTLGILESFHRDIAYSLCDGGLDSFNAFKCAIFLGHPLSSGTTK